MKKSPISKSISAVFCGLILAGSVSAAKVEILYVRSDSMNKDVPVSVILPDGYDPGKKHPVVYLLHGACGNHRSLTRQETLFQCDRYGFVGVVPDGGYTSWWWDSPVDPTYRYETFVAHELRSFVEARYAIDARRERRAILGGSMGGHGACWIGFRHKDLFGAVGSIFGGVDVRPFPGRWGIDKRLGPLKGNEDVWKAHSVVTEAAKLSNGDVELCMMIGTRDFFLDINRQMHDLLAKKGIEHTYIEYTTESPSTSAHNLTFLDYAQPVMFKFIDNYFRTGSGQLATGCRPHIGARMLRKQSGAPTQKKKNGRGR